MIPNEQIFTRQSLILAVSAVQVFWKNCGKGEIAHNEQFLLIPQCFLPFSAILIKLEIVVCKLSQFGRVQNLSFGKGLAALRKKLFKNFEA